MKHFIYTLSDPRTKIVRYVGKTNNPVIRYAMHRCEKRGTHKNNWLHQLRSLGLRPVMDVIEEIDCAADEWEDRERFWIYHFRQMGFPLTNLDSGGVSGKQQSEETKSKIRAKAIGRKQTPESIAKMKATKSEGWTPERRERYRLAQLGKKQSDATREKRSKSLMGRQVSEETKRKIRESNKARWTPERRAWMRDKNIAQKNISPTFRASNS